MRDPPGRPAGRGPPADPPLDQVTTNVRRAQGHCGKEQHAREDRPGDGCPLTGIGRAASPVARPICACESRLHGNGGFGPVSIAAGQPQPAGAAGHPQPAGDPGHRDDGQPEAEAEGGRLAQRHRPRPRPADHQPGGQVRHPGRHARGVGQAGEPLRRPGPLPLTRRRDAHPARQRGGDHRCLHRRHLNPAGPARSGYRRVLEHRPPAQRHPRRRRREAQAPRGLILAGCCGPSRVTMRPERARSPGPSAPAGAHARSA
jgi:hypothetical protein